MARAPGEHGRFEGSVETEWLNDGRRMRLLSDLAYIDPAVVRWPAPKGSVVDGASIPRILWSAVGAPFTGKYRTASVVHDVACVERARPWRAVHRMFYEACLCGGVSETVAKVLYAGVFHFGPRWEAVDEKFEPGATLMPAEVERRRTRKVPPAPADRASLSLEFFGELQGFVRAKNPTLEEIEAFRPTGD